jgi:alkylation response protein AidB-like acyl-CoA dehydrogenase
MSKLVAGETAVRVTDQAIQILGGIQRMLIGRAITGLDVR